MIKVLCNVVSITLTPNFAKLRLNELPHGFMELEDFMTFFSFYNSTGMPFLRFSCLCSIWLTVSVFEVRTQALSFPNAFFSGCLCRQPSVSPRAHPGSGLFEISHPCLFLSVPSWGVSRSSPFRHFSHMVLYWQDTEILKSVKCGIGWLKHICSPFLLVQYEIQGSVLPCDHMEKRIYFWFFCWVDIR